MAGATWHKDRRSLLKRSRLRYKRSFLLIFMPTLAMIGLSVPYETSSRCDRHLHVERSNKSSVAVVIPFVVGKTNNSLDSWSSVGNPCTNVKTDIWFYANKGEADLDGRTFLSTMFAASAIHGHRQCFGQLQIMYANLTDEEDVYPAGPSNMFFYIYLKESMSHFRFSYDYMYWMEWDVQPVKPGWLDCIHAAANEPGNFWMKGSITQGPRLNHAATNEADWDWIGHINGNAMYALQDDAFNQFLAVVVAYEPPNHFWKPFDISIWRTLHSFPYMWTAYQRYRSKFAYGEFIRHDGFGNGSHIDEGNCLVHGSPISASKKEHKKKFSVLPTDVSWDDALSASHKISVFVAHEDMPVAVVALKSIVLNMPNFHEIVFVVAEDEVEHAQNITHHMPVQIKGEPRIFADLNLQQTYSRLMASAHCTGTYIFHLDPDVVIVREILNRDLFWLDKPISIYEHSIYSNHIAPGKELRHWQSTISESLGIKVDNEYSISRTHMYPRDMYVRARGHLQQRLDTSLIDFLGTLARTTAKAGDEVDVETGQIDVVSHTFSATNFLGAYLWHFEHSSIAWVQVLPDETDTFPMPIIPEFACRGNSVRAKAHNRYIEHMKALLAALDSGTCGCFCSSEGLCC